MKRFTLGTLFFAGGWCMAMAALNAADGDAWWALALGIVAMADLWAGSLYMRELAS